MFRLETPGGGGFGAPAGSGAGRGSEERDEGFVHGEAGERTFFEPAQFGSYFDYLRTWNESV